MTKNTTNDEEKDIKRSYAQVNGLKMYYEIHGRGRPLVLLHGALSTIDTDFGRVLQSFAKTRQVIAIEQQAHGHTADIDRPLKYGQMVEDTVALLQHIKIKYADFFGYSMGAGIALQIAIKYPNMVHKLVAASISYKKEGFHHEVIEGIGNLKPEQLEGSPFQEAYAKIAPNPEDWPKLIEKVDQLNRHIPDCPPEAIKSIKTPMLIIAGDSDVIRPEHAIEIFRLLGGGVPGDLTGLPDSQLAILPGTTHINLVERANWLLSMITEFLDAPMPELE